MINKFKDITNTDFSFLKEAKLLVTISGGIDSIVLTHLLHQLGFDITIAHCNFHLRGIDSDHDEQFVITLANTLKLPYFITHFDTKLHAKNHKLSIQEAARNLRYEWFEQIRINNNLDYIITAHNLNDSLETFLINLTRSTGLKGLTGIPITNNKIVRPLSSFSRNDIEHYANVNKITWREDKSNSDTKYTRNKIRHQVIPVLEELNPNLLDSFKQTLENLKGSEAIINDRLTDVINKSQETRAKKQDVFKFNIEFLHNLPNLKAYLFEIFSPYGFTNIIDIENLLTTQSGKQVFSKTHRLIKDREQLLLERLNENKGDKIENREEKIEKKEAFFINENDSTLNIQSRNIEIIFKIQHFNTNIYESIKDNFNIAHFDKNLLKFPLLVRRWQKGDYFYPIGMRGKKKLSKYFKDEKLSLIQKENIWLLLSDNKIVWVIGKRQDNRFKITSTTNNITKISILK